MSKRIISALLLVIICFLFCACNGGSSDYAERTDFAMDAVLTVRLWGCDEEAEVHFSAIFDLVDEVESALSRTLPESDVSRINRDRSAADLSPHTLSVLAVASEVTSLTDGTYLATLGAVTDLWHQAGEKNELPDAAALSAALAAARLGFTLEEGRCTVLGEGALLDLGSIGKGYALDRIKAYLEENAVPGALVSFGSAVLTHGEKSDGAPFRISLRDPDNANGTVGTLVDPVGLLSVSGDYERYVTVGGRRYHHIIDPESGYPSDSGLSSVSVLAPSATVADALSTALLVMGEEAARDLLAASEGGEAVFITAEGTVSTTEGLSGCFEPKS